MNSSSSSSSSNDPNIIVRRISENDAMPPGAKIAHDKMRKEYNVDKLQTGPQLKQSFQMLEKSKTWGGRRRRRRTKRMRRTKKMRRHSRRRVHRR